jgi:hypothetical protein
MSHHSAKRITSVGLWLLVVAVADALPQASRQGTDVRTKVSVWRTPDGGIQPQAAVDSAGVLHLIYFKGAPSAGDIFYVRRGPRDTDFSEPIRVNSHPGSAVAVGSVRGAHIAVGRGGRVHVAWMGSRDAQPKSPGNATPMLYARSNDARTSFEAQRNVVQHAVGLDGGGSVAADDKGNVYVAWHAGPEGKGEESRRVWVARSADGGETFGREVGASDEATGACGCCGMRAFAGRDGALYMLYRAATKGVDRDMYLVSSNDFGRSFRGTRLHAWKLEACPMSTASISEGVGETLLAWETNGQVYYSRVGRKTSGAVPPVSAPGEGLRRKHPVVVANSEGQTILLWTEKTGWQKGGSVAWQMFDEGGRPTAEKGAVEGVPAWSLVTAYALPDGRFAVVY